MFKIDKTTSARHFTNHALQLTTGNKDAKVDAELEKLVHMMNAMYFIVHQIRIPHKSFSKPGYQPRKLEKRSKLFALLGCGDGADQDPEEFVARVGKITGVKGQ